MRRRFAIAFFVAAVTLAPIAPGLFAYPAAAATVRPIIFPIIGSANFSNDFGAPRVGHTHQGNDIFAAKGTPLVAVASGRVRWVVDPSQPDRSLGFSISDADGYEYWYLHINNDTPGTDDGSSRGIFAYAPDVYGGNPVTAGQLLGWVGDSGNAERTTPHLHFELHEPDGDAINPFATLTNARRISKPVTPPPLDYETLPYNQFTGGASIAVGNVDGNNPENELVVGPAAGGGPLVRVYNSDMSLDAQFYAFDKENRNGFDVAAGDVDGDGVAEIIVGGGPGTVPEVRIFTVHGELRQQFLAYGASFRGGINVAAADMNFDGKADVVTAPRKGGGPHVKVFDGETGWRRSQFFAYGEKFRGGVDIAAYPPTATTPPLIVTAAGSGGGPHIRVFDGSTQLRYSQFFAGDTSFRGGIRLDAGNVDLSTTEPEIVTVPLSNGSPRARVWTLLGSEVTNRRFFEPWWEGGYDTAIGFGSIFVVNGPPTEARRRTSIRSLTTGLDTPWWYSTD